MPNAIVAASGIHPALRVNSDGANWSFVSSMDDAMREMLNVGLGRLLVWIKSSVPRKNAFNVYCGLLGLDRSSFLEPGGGARRFGFGFGL